MRRIYRRWLSGWIGSLVVLLLVAFGLKTAPIFTLVICAGVVAALVLLLGYVSVPLTGAIRKGYWFLAPAAISSLHFLPPRELHAVRRQMGLLQALHLLQDFLSQLDAHGIGLL